ncbi:MAG: Ig-like domain-containing protein [Terriglobales bacterium]
MRRSQILAFLILTILAVLFIAGCNNFFTSGSSIASITVSPASRLAAVNDTVNFTASGTTVNGDTKDVTTTATWTSSAPNVATIDNAGKATALATGATTIQAKQDDGVGTAALIVGSGTCTLSISPSNPTVFQTQGTQQFTATCTFPDNSQLNVTNYVQWTSGTTTVATINKTGLATLLTAGTTQITATIATASGSVTANTTLTVQ